MKFILTYDGELPSSGNSSRKNKEKWEIRKQFSPQLEHLWNTHPGLKMALFRRYVPQHSSFFQTDVHHLSTSAIQPAYPPKLVEENVIDLCAPKKVGQVEFRPLVRDSYALACSLKILFLRNEPIGRIYKGGDLDNRIKTLLDALQIPEPEQVPEDASEQFMHVLLENDALVTGLAVDAQQLLNRPQKSESEVSLIIEVTVTVMDARGYNVSFLGG
jgi:hypothetical protein